MKAKPGKLICVLLLAAVLLYLPVSVGGSSGTPLSAFSYTLDETAGTVLLEDYTGSYRTVAVPGTYSLGGKTYQVVLDAASVFQKNTDLAAVSIDTGVTFRNGSMRALFSGCSQLSRVQLGQGVGTGVTDMAYLFADCGALEELDLSGLQTGQVTNMDCMFYKCKSLDALTGYESWDTGAVESMYLMFAGTYGLDRVDLRGWDLDQVKNTGWCFQSCGASQVLLPDDLAVISAGFFNHLSAWEGETFTVPAGVKRIGYGHTFYDFGTDAFTAFAVAEGNESFTAVDGILYSADGRELLAVPRGKTFPEGVFEIPEGVTFLGELCFSRNYNIQTLVLPDSYELIQSVPVNDERYIVYEDKGNLNSGNSLSIAIYKYTGITAYAVKADNPRYASLDGILYSKDMTQVAAIPTRYQGRIVIPEGVTAWNTEALWTVDVGTIFKCTGVSLPATLIDIAPDQLAKLNRLAQSGLPVTVAEENPAYRVNAQGELEEKLPVSAAQITLDQESFVYDGTPKTPVPTLILDEVTLIQGTDYALTYENNTDAGEASLTVIGLGIYGGGVRIKYTIEPAPALPTDAPEGITGTYGQTLAQLTLPEGYCWADDSQSLGDAGEKTFGAIYSGGGPNYRPTQDIPVTVTVLPKQITPQISGLEANYLYTGQAIRPQIQLLDGQQPIAQTEYTLEFSNNIQPGTATVTLCDAPGGNYTLSGSFTFTIAPQKKPPYWLALPVLLAAVAVPLCLRRKKKK